MASERNYYNILGVGADATEEEVRRAFRKRALEWHPDRNQSKDAEERFKEFNEAYQVLIDPEKRKLYDRYGRVDPGAERGFEGFDIPGGFGDIFDAFFGGFGARTEAGPRRGADLHSTFKVSFQEAALGVTRELHVRRSEVCPACDGRQSAPGSSPASCDNCRGTGRIRRAHSSLFGQFTQVVGCNVCHGEGKVIQERCPTCKGLGHQQTSRSLSVDVPAGIDDGMQIRLAGEGDAGGKGGTPGDLYLSVSVRPHPLFRRDKANLLLDLPVNLAQAALGTTTDVPMLDGSVESILVPSGVQPGTVLRVKQKGVPNLSNGRRGDLLVRVQVVTPERLGNRARTLLQELADVLDEEDTANGSGPKSWLDRLKETFKGEDN
jgi:molecular chaperone DnaJ